MLPCQCTLKWSRYERFRNVLCSTPALAVRFQLCVGVLMVLACANTPVGLCMPKSMMLWVMQGFGFFELTAVADGSAVGFH